MQALLSALLTGLPLSYPGLWLGGSQRELVQCYLKCSSFFRAKSFCSDNLSSRAIGALARTKPVQPARPTFLVTSRFLEAEEYEFCTPSVSKCLQGLLHRIR